MMSGFVTVEAPPSGADPAPSSSTSGYLKRHMSDASLVRSHHLSMALDAPPVAISPSRSHGELPSPEAAGAPAQPQTPADALAHSPSSSELTRDDASEDLQPIIDDPHTLLLRRIDSGAFIRKFNLSPDCTLLYDALCYRNKSGLPISGRMYISDRNMCFYSKHFGTKIREVVPFRDITGIAKRGVGSIEVATKSEKTVFSGFMVRDKAFHYLCGAWEHGLAMPASSNPQADIPAVDLAQQEPEPQQVKRASWKISKSSHTRAESEAGSSSHGRSIRQSAESGAPASSAPAEDSNSKPVSPKSPEQQRSGAEQQQQVPAAEPAGAPASAAAAPQGNYDLGGIVVSQTAEDGTACGFFRSQAKTECCKGEIPISVFGFWKEFFSDASTGWDDFHVRRGDKGVVSGKWETHPQFGTYRERKYTIEVKGSPFGPPTSRVEEKQHYSFTKSKIIVEIQTNTLDVPFSDCFTAEQRYVAEEVSPSSCVLTVTVGMHWAKKTLFKGKIESMMIKTSKETWSLFLEMAKEHVAKLSPAVLQSYVVPEAVFEDYRKKAPVAAAQPAPAALAQPTQAAAGPAAPAQAQAAQVFSKAPAEAPPREPELQLIPILQLVTTVLVLLMMIMLYRRLGTVELLLLSNQHALP
eukprot:m51a1_g5734 hypothetical protein (638) ;mRNA; f:1139261-1141745